jgi:hypothetical protein
VAQLGNWTEAELYQYAEEALHDAGGRYVLIAGIDSTTALVANQTLYPTLPNQIATIYASAGGAMLAPSSVAEMEALDDDWEEAAAADPTRWVGNNLGEEFIAVYPPSEPLQSSGAAVEQSQPAVSETQRGPGFEGRIPTSDINLDPTRFQFKQEGIGQKGVGDQFRDVTTWDAVDSQRDQRGVRRPAPGESGHQ